VVGTSYIGRELGRYKLVSVIGSGGFATVYRAVDTGLERTVALKVVDPSAHHNPTIAHRFVREGQTVASLDHPAVVPVYDAGETDGILWMAMRLIEGGSLDDALRADRRLSPDQVVAVVARIGGALDHAHAHGLVHRDVKPSNILLEENDPRRAWLADFGIAVTAQNMGQFTTGALGTAAYMAPEQSRPGSAGPPADVYSLACVAYEMVTGSRPYPGDEYVALLMAHLNQAVPRCGHPGIDELMERALAKDPARRPASGAALAQELRRALDAGAGTTAHLPLPSGDTTQPYRPTATAAERPAGSPGQPGAPDRAPAPGSPGRPGAPGQPGGPGQRGAAQAAIAGSPGQQGQHSPPGGPQRPSEPPVTVIEPRNDTLLHPAVHRPPPPVAPQPQAQRPAPPGHRPPPPQHQGPPAPFTRRDRPRGRNRLLAGTAALVVAAVATFLALQRPTTDTVLVRDDQGIAYRVPRDWRQGDVDPVTEWRGAESQLLATVANFEAGVVPATTLLAQVEIESVPVCESTPQERQVDGAATGGSCTNAAGDVAVAVGAVGHGQFWLVIVHPGVPEGDRDDFVDSIELFQPE